MTHHRGTEDTEGPSVRHSSDILGAAIEVHRRLGPGLLESAYEACLCRELLFRHIPIQRQVPLPLDYRGLKLDCGYLTYLKLTGIRLGLLINFNVEMLRSGIYRIVNE